MWPLRNFLAKLSKRFQATPCSSELASKNQLNKDSRHLFQVMFHDQDRIPFLDGVYESLSWEKEKGYRGYISSQGTRLKCL